MGDVQGIVTLDGKNLREGIIKFVPMDGKSMTAGGVIRDGKFAFAAPITKHRIDIGATVESSPPGTPRDQITTRALIPERYNSKSELTYEVKAGRNEPVFQLKSK